MVWRIEVASADPSTDAAGARLKESIVSLDIHSVERVNVARLYFILGKISESEIHRLARMLLKDPITEDYAVDSSVFTESEGVKYVSIVYNPEYPHARVILGLVENRLGKFDTSIKTLTQALSYTKGKNLPQLDAFAYYGLSVAYANKRDYVKASLFIEKSLRLNPASRASQELARRLKQ